MKFLTHAAAGILVGYGVASADPSAILISYSGAILGSLLPDVDVATSKIGRTVKPASFAIQVICGHRGIFHAPLLWLAAFVICCTAMPEATSFFQAVLYGIGSHLLLDMLNPSGIPLLWPIRKRISIAPIPSGGILDAIIGLLLLALCIYWHSTTIFPSLKYQMEAIL